MLNIELRDREGDLIAEIETQEGVVPRVGDVVRLVCEGKAAGDYKVEFVRWNLSPEGQSVQIMMESTGKHDLWPEGAPAPENVRVLFKDKKKPDEDE